MVLLQSLSHNQAGLCTIRRKHGFSSSHVLDMCFFYPPEQWLCQKYRLSYTFVTFITHCTSDCRKSIENTTQCELHIFTHTAGQYFFSIMLWQRGAQAMLVRGFPNSKINRFSRVSIFGYVNFANDFCKKMACCIGISHMYGTKSCLVVWLKLFSCTSKLLRI